MDPCEATNVLLSKIKTLEPENASKIMGYILIQDIKEQDLVRLAYGPETLLQSVIIKAKTHLGISTNSLFSPSSPSSNQTFFNQLSKTAANPFSQASQRVINEGSFGRNLSLSPHSWPIGENKGSSSSNCSVISSPKSSPFLSYDNIRAGCGVVVPPFGKNEGNGGGGCSNNNSGNGDFLDEYQLDEYLSFLDDSSSKNEDFMDQGVQLGGFSVSNGDTHLHRRRFSESDACFGGEDGGFGMGYRPCMYFARGFCKNGETCKFVHGGGGFGVNNIVEVNGGGGPIVGSPREMEGLYLQQQQQQQHEELMRMKAAQQQQQQQRLAYNKYMNFLLQQQNDPERLGTAAAMMSDEFHKFGPFGPERNEFLAMGMAEKANSASRQIYLTFPADSTFKDEDVSNYFGTFGPVQDVRIPYQQKRMFGFVTFVLPETVRLILARGNPHFICDSRVLVKPYKEKGKVANNGRRQHLQQQLLERGNFSPGSSPSGLSPRELYDLHIGARMLHNMQDIMLRKKLEEQAELQQAIELQGRRFINLQLPDLRGDYVRHHQRSLSVGAPFSSPTHTPVNQHTFFCSDGKNEESIEDNYKSSAAATSFSPVPAELSIEHEVNAAQNNGTFNDKEKSPNPEGFDGHECLYSNGRNVDHALPDNLFVSPAKSSGNQHEDNSLDLAAVEENTESENNAVVPTPSGDVTH